MNAKIEEKIWNFQRKIKRDAPAGLAINEVFSLPKNLRRNHKKKDLIFN